MAVPQQALSRKQSILSFVAFLAILSGMTLTIAFSSSLFQSYIGMGLLAADRILGIRCSELAIPLLRSAAERGSTPAQSIVGAMYARGVRVRRDLVRGKKYLEQAAAKGDLESQQLLAVMMWATATPATADETFAYITRAAESGSPDSYYHLGEIYQWGLGQSPDKTKAHEAFVAGARLGNASAQWRAGDNWTLKGAQQGIPAAQDDVASHLIRNDESKSEAVTMWLKAAKHGNLRACTAIGVGHYFGFLNNTGDQWLEAGAKRGSSICKYLLKRKPGSADERLRAVRREANSGVADAQATMAKLSEMGFSKSDDAKSLYEKAAANGSADANLALADYIHPLETESQIDFVRCKQLLEKAAQAGQGQAQFMLSHQYLHGIGVGADRSRALELLQSSAKAGIPEAQVALGEMYTQGFAIEQNPAQGMRWLQAAADQGYAPALLNLANLKVSEGGQANYKEAIDLLQESCKQGYLPAMSRLSSMYTLGIGVKMSGSEGIALLEKVAKEGDPEANYTLGCNYRGGLWVEQNAAKAATYLQAAADAGVMQARIILADMYASGEGVDKSAAKARQLYDLAAKQGSVLAKEKLKRLKN